LNTRFYSSVSLIVTFGAGGVFAAVFSYYDSLNRAPVKNELARWSIIITMILAGLLFIFFLSPIQDREYESAFTSFGSTLGFCSLLFVRGKIEV
jgi:membrane-bound acyltransferase YfiQ involved in biofilm formation